MNAFFASKITWLIAFLIALGVIGYGGYRHYDLRKTFAEAKRDFAASKEEYEKKIADREHENKDLSEALDREKNQNDIFEEQIKKLSGTVGTLKKLSETDPELLQKYSKVYFLNENYAPARLANIPSEYVRDANRTIQFHADALSRLEDLLADAKEDDLELRVASGYRSFAEQKQLKSGYQVLYGKGANAFSADQGYSEHQLGTAVDFTIPALGGGLGGFEKTEAYAWLENRAYRYGFILSYPQGNAYYQFEPWHWRFVGVDLARKLHRDEKSFYDLDQRQIDTYLVNIFD